MEAKLAFFLRLLSCVPGHLQPHKSILPESRVWALAPRPGPGSYKLPGTIGVPVFDSGIATSPSAAFRLTSHEGANILKHQVGGKISDNGSGVAIGAERVVLSTKPTPPKVGFGTSKREHSAVTYSSFTYSPH